jgi:hypothetical protein
MVGAGGRNYQCRLMTGGLAPWCNSGCSSPRSGVIRSRARPYLPAGHMAYGTVANRLERDHDGLAVRGRAVD